MTAAREPQPPDPSTEQALFRALAEASAAITFVYQGERNVYANPAAERVTGYSRAELLEKKFWDIIHPDSRELIRQRGMARQRGEPVPPNYLVQIVTRQGSTRWLDFTGVTVEIGGAPAVLGTAFDVTEQVRVREALHASEANYRRLFDNAQVGVLQTNLQGEILAANQAAVNLLGCADLAELRTMRIQDLYQDPAERERLVARLQSEGKVEHLELSWKSRAGEPLQVEASIALEGDVLSGMLVDVTERRRLEREALRAQRLESLGTLAGGLAHDFNNLLAAILGNISLARHSARPDDPLREWLGEAELACQRARGLTQQLLSFARGGSPLTRRVDPRRLLEEAVGFGLRGSRVACEWVLPGTLPLLEVDEGQVSQVIHNLVLNAVQAMPAGGSLRVGAEVLDGRLQLSFEDSGPGIRPADQARIFDPYYTTKPRGVGLGLATAHSIVKRHGGSLRVESHPPPGARFLLDLPLATDQTPLAPPPTLGESAAPGAGRVLVMDDEEPIRRATATILSELGYEPATYPDGREAVSAYERALQEGRPFQLVLLDLTVRGGMGGLEALDRLRRLDPRVCAVLISGYVSDPALERARELGFAARLQKPFTVDELASCLREATG